MAKLNRAITIKLPEAVHELLKSRAREAGIDLAQYARRELVRSTEVSYETALVLGAIERHSEMTVRIYESSVTEALTPSRLRQIQESVRAIDLWPLIRGLVTRALKQGGVE